VSNYSAQIGSWVFDGEDGLTDTGGILTTSKVISSVYNFQNGTNAALVTDYAGGYSALDGSNNTMWQVQTGNKQAWFGAAPVTQPSGDVGAGLVSLGLFSSATVNPSVTMTSNTTATATFNTSNNDETIYDTSTTLLTALTIALPSTTRVGQILRYVSNRTVTTTTVTGTVAVGASPTLAQNTAIAYQAINTTGSFLRIQ
jgi:hypothetical protein